MGFDLQKSEYSSSCRACSKVASIQAKLSIYEVLSATTHSKADPRHLISSIQKSMQWFPDLLEQSFQALSSHPIPTVVSFTFPPDILFSLHLSSLPLTLGHLERAQLTEACEHKLQPKRTTGAMSTTGGMAMLDKVAAIINERLLRKLLIQGQTKGTKINTSD